MEMIEVKLFDKKTKINEGMKLSVPVYGIGTIKSISKKEILGEKILFCELIFSDGMVLSIPVNQMSDMKVRSVISEEMVKKIKNEVLDKNPKNNKNNWNKRIQEYKEKLSSGDINLIAELVRDLFICTKDFNKSYGEREIYYKAFDLLIKEFSISLGESENEISKNITDILNKNIKADNAKISIDENINNDNDDDYDFEDDDDEEIENTKSKKTA